MIGLGLPTRADGTVLDTRRYGHLPRLWQEFSCFASGPVAATYAAIVTPIPSAPGPFDTWDVNDRYASDTTTPSKLAEFASHQNSARDFIALLELAIEDGIA